MVRLQKLINWEENVLRQKSKCQWIQAGDKLEFKILFQNVVAKEIQKLYHLADPYKWGSV